jgi:hypothetical protein
MPARSKGPVTEIPYGRRGAFPAFVMRMESQNLQARNEVLARELEEAISSTNQSTVARRDEEGKNERHQVNFEEVKRYLSLKLQDKEQKIRFYRTKLKNTRDEREKFFRSVNFFNLRNF